MMPRSEYMFYLGCTIPYRSAENAYEISSRKILEKLGVGLIEMPEFNCCGLPFDSMNHDLMLTLAARNLCQAEEKNRNMLILCNGCFGTLNKVNKMLKEDEKLRERVNEYLSSVGMKFKGSIEVFHLVQVLAENVGYDRLKETIEKPLDKLEVAEYSGCHLFRPLKRTGFDDPENPTLLKKLIESTGAKCLNYANENECCGEPVLPINSQLALQLAGEKLVSVKAVGAQALITICPACHLMFDANQRRVEKALNESLDIPVLHYSQLLGLAMGFGPDELALDRLTVSASKILDAL